MGVRNTGSGVRRARSSVTVGKLFHPELQSPWQVGGGGGNKDIFVSYFED